VAIQVVLGSFKYWFSSDMVSIFSTAMVAYAILALLKVYHVLYEHCHGLNAMTKVTAVKGTIGLVLGEGFLEEVLFAFGVIKTSEFENSLRLYCFAVVCELFVIALLLERVLNSEIKLDNDINTQFQPQNFNK
jgi:membrane protein YdbS with pleckstrin-like domain